MVNFKYLQKLFFLLVVGLSLYTLQACSNDDENDSNEPFEVPSTSITDIAVISVMDSYGITYVSMTGYIIPELLPAGNGTPEIGLEICPSANDMTSSRQETLNIMTENVFSVEINHLSPDTEYKYRLFVRYEKLTYYGEYKTFSTKNIGNVTTTGEASDITRTSANITSNFQTDLLDPKDSLKVGVAYSTHASALQIGGTFQSQSLSVRNVSEGTYNIMLSGLSPKTRYYYASFIEAEGKYCFSDIKSFTTKEFDFAKSGAVDLGLSVKWAAHNVGASSPEEYGSYYAWGEIEEKSDYSWSTYKWCNGSPDATTKYCTNSNYGTVDNKTILDPEDDVAHVKWGDNWRMPTLDEINELIYNCTWDWITYDEIPGKEVKGYLITGPNHNSIFLPAAGDRDGTSTYGHGSHGCCWSATLYEQSNRYAYSLGFDYGDYYRSHSNRYRGRTVRPVTD